jgi:hypothetical protein
MIHCPELGRRRKRTVMTMTAAVGLTVPKMTLMFVIMSRREV